MYLTLQFLCAKFAWFIFPVEINTNLVYLQYVIISLVTTVSRLTWTVT